MDVKIRSSVERVNHPRRRPTVPILAGLIAVVAAGAAPSPAAWDGRERLQADLLVILAHPDDEGVVAPLIAREALGGRRVGVVYLTDGRNGTNRAGSLAGASFGIARLTELSWTLRRLGASFHLCLDRADGLGRGDPSVVVRGWGRERTVADLTRLIRLYRPSGILTWHPGPASSNADHAASGGAALLASAAAADPAFEADQIQSEGLEPWATPEVWLVAQTEKLGYDVYPGPLTGSREPSATVRVVDLDVAAPGSERRYTDIAREALREQRFVAAASNLGRGGPFDEPLRLFRAGPDARADDPGAGASLRLGGGRSATQAFLEDLAGELGWPGLLMHFAPEASATQGESTSVVLQASWGGGMKGKVSLELPDGWRSEPSKREVEAAPGETVALEWTLRPSPEAPTGHHAAHLLARPAGRGREAIRAPFVVTLTRR